MMCLILELSIVKTISNFYPITLNSIDDCCCSLCWSYYPSPKQKQFFLNNFILFQKSPWMLALRVDQTLLRSWTRRYQTRTILPAILSLTGAATVARWDSLILGTWTCHRGGDVVVLRRLLYIIYILIYTLSELHRDATENKVNGRCEINTNIV